MNLIDKITCIVGGVVGFSIPVATTTYLAHYHNPQYAPIYTGIGLALGLTFGVVAGTHTALRLRNKD